MPRRAGASPRPALSVDASGRLVFRAGPGRRRWTEAQIIEAATAIGLPPPDNIPPRKPGSRHRHPLYIQWRRLAMEALLARWEGERLRRERTAARKRHQEAVTDTTARWVARSIAYATASEIRRDAQFRRHLAAKDAAFQQRIKDRRYAHARLAHAIKARAQAHGLLVKAEEMRGRQEERAESWRRAHLAATFPGFRCQRCGLPEEPARWAVPRVARRMTIDRTCWRCHEWAGWWMLSVEMPGLVVVVDGWATAAGEPLGVVPPWWGQDVRQW